MLQRHKLHTILLHKTNEGDDEWTTPVGHFSGQSIHISNAELKHSNTGHFILSPRRFLERRSSHYLCRHANFLFK